jgi:hypothetical protein
MPNFALQEHQEIQLTLDRARVYLLKWRWTVNLFASVVNENHGEFSLEYVL